MTTFDLLRTHRRARLSLAIALGAWALGTQPAYAQPTSDAQTAEALFRDARAAMRANDYATACPKLEASQRLDPSHGTLLNLATCEEKRGRVATAYRHFQVVRDALPAGDARLAMARDAAVRLEKRVPHLRLIAKGGRTGLAVTLDGAPLAPASIGTSLALDPGEHVVVVGAAPDAETTRITLAEGESRDEELALAPSMTRTRPPTTSTVPAAPTAAVTEPTPTRATPEPAGGAHRTAAYVVTAAGGASVVASLIFGAFVLQKKSTVGDHCRDKVCDATGLAAGSAGSTFDALATATFVGGAIALGAGTYLFLSAPPADTGRNHARPLQPTVTLTGTF